MLFIYWVCYKIFCTRENARELFAWHMFRRTTGILHVLGWVSYQNGTGNIFLKVGKQFSHWILINIYIAVLGLSPSNNVLQQLEFTILTKRTWVSLNAVIWEIIFYMDALRTKLYTSRNTKCSSFLSPWNLLRNTSVLPMYGARNQTRKSKYT